MKSENQRDLAGDDAMTVGKTPGRSGNGRFRFETFTIKEIAFIAILSVVLLLVSGAVMPIVMFTNIFALRQLASSLLFSFFCCIAIRKVPKIGTLTLLGVFCGTVLLFMSPIMFFNQVVGAVLAELVVFLLFGSYEKMRAVVLSAGLYIPMTLPITLIVTMLMRGETIQAQFGEPLLPTLCILGTIGLSFLGAFLGWRLGDELKRAGKL